MIGVRIASALVMGTVSIAAFWKGGDTLAVFLALVSAFAMDEWVRLVEPECSRLERSVAVAAMFAALVLPRLVGYPAGAVILIGATAILAGIARLTGAVHPLRLAAGLPYIGLAAISLSWVRTIPQAGPWLILYVLVVVWATDTGGYVIGKTFGGPKLAPLISPKKTWSGWFGGLFFAMGAAAMLAYGHPASHPAAMVALAAFLAVVAQFGDLLESSIKRRYNIKDSGNIIPGHGGILDRVDGLLLTAPVFALWQMSYGMLYPWW